MTLLDQLLDHDAWTTEQLLKRARLLTNGELDQEFDLGHRTIRRTFSHLVANVEIWSLLISDNDLSQRWLPRDDVSIDELLVAHRMAAARLAKTSRTILSEDRWSSTFVDVLDGETKEYGVAIAHVLTHSTHHRTQLLYMLRKAGLPDLPEGDVFSWFDTQDKPQAQE